MTIWQARHYLDVHALKITGYLNIWAFVAHFFGNLLKHPRSNLPCDHMLFTAAFSYTFCWPDDIFISSKAQKLTKKYIFQADLKVNVDRITLECLCLPSCTKVAKVAAEKK